MMNDYKSICGSALIETTVLMLVMLPVVFAMVMMGNLIDLKQTTEQASRYTAWETTIRPAAFRRSSPAADVENRFFQSPLNPISSKQFLATKNPLWNGEDPNNDSLSEEFVLRINPRTLDVNSEHSPSRFSPALEVGKAISRSGEILSNVSGNEWGLSANGVLSSTVAVTLENSDWLPTGGMDCPDTASGLCLKSKTSIYNDDWSASHDVQAIKRIRSLMPASALQPVGDALSVVGNLPLFSEIKDLKHAFGYVDMSLLPEYESR